MVDVSSGVESARGIKNNVLIEKFIQYVHASS
jgi:phosphoribosylanthranilate isomerase